ncbi:hypothetical protein AGMMS4952_26500 [Spirochaetia bacterium]|nr:hypothetical protein AGMMS4952_26500 [Spirochaetia bacterium]
MADIYNFNKHIGNIIKQNLHDNGFRKNGNHFTRNFNDLVEDIFIHSHYGSWALINKEFYINIIITKDNKWVNYIRIPNKPSRDKPNMYDDYYNRNINEKNNFNKDQEEIFHKYTRDLMWEYKDEDELINSFTKASDILEKYGLKYIGKVEQRILEDSEIKKDKFLDIYNEIFTWSHRGFGYMF